MLSRWRSKCFFDRPAKYIYALIYSGWFRVQPARPLLKRKGFTVMREHYHATHVRRYKRCRKSLLNGPARCESVTKCSWGYTYSFRPVFQTHGFIVEGEQSSLNCIALLLLACCPSAIARFVVAIFVRVSIERCVGWSWTHICKEIEKGIPPSFTDGYSSSAISMISSRIRTIAARLHHFPRVVLRAFTCGVPASFRLLTRCNRIACSHPKLLYSFMVVRAEAVVVNCFGSFHCASQHKAVQ